MALTDAATVRNIGGLNEADAYNLFRLADDATFNTLVTATIADASAWLALRAPADYADTEPNKRAMFKRGEACLTLHFLMLPLKARKTLGTQWPTIQEDTARFEELIQIDWYEQMRSLLEPYLIVEVDEKPFAAPVMVLGKIIDRTPAGGQRDSSRQLQTDIDEAIARTAFPVVTTVSSG